jgi:hypothetical protein
VPKCNHVTASDKGVKPAQSLVDESLLFLRPVHPTVGLR